MNRLLLLIALGCFSIANAQDPIFTPTMAISTYGTVDSPAAEQVEKIIDGLDTTKYLDFQLTDGMGFNVDLGGTSYIATSIQMTTANDFEVRDPMLFEVSGSNDGTTYSSIASGAIPCIATRFSTRQYDFANTNAYMFYRVNYTNACDPSGGTGIPSMQVAETQLLGTLLSVDDFEISNKFSIYPNPSQGSFTLSYSGNEVLIDAYISDISGKIVKKIDLYDFDTRRKIQLEQATSGIYFIKINGTETSITKKLLLL
jgi:hypothetical protein